jgi:hypothetical protein
MARKKSRGTELKVFSGREARLNRVIFMILDSKKHLTSYDMYLEIRRIKGYRHVKRQSVDRRMKVLCEQHWIVKDGVKLAKAHFLSPLYALSIRAQAALTVNGTDLNNFIQIAPENDLQVVINILSVYL